MSNMQQRSHAAAEIDVCPICGAPGAKPEIDELARQWVEEYRDRNKDLRAFGAPISEPCFWFRLAMRGWA
jgi:hypothetical protein